MIDGYLFVHKRRFKPIRYSDVLELGRLIEPEVNAKGIRTVEVRVGANSKMASYEVGEALAALVSPPSSITLLSLRALRRSFPCPEAPRARAGARSCG